jgi:hypothetical protein
VIRHDAMNRVTHRRFLAATREFSNTWVNLREPHGTREYLAQETTVHIPPKVQPRKRFA